MTVTKMLVECPACLGEKGWESRAYGFDRQIGYPLTYWIECETCNGKGEIEEEVRLIDQDDLDEIDVEEKR